MSDEKNKTVGIRQENSKARKGDGKVGKGVGDIRETSESVGNSDSKLSRTLKIIRSYVDKKGYDAGAFKDYTDCVVEIKDNKLARQENKELISLVERTMIKGRKEGNIDNDIARALVLAEQEAKLRLARLGDFNSFLEYMELDREADKCFYLPRRKELRDVVETIQALLDDELDIATVSLPPGTGKSTLSIFLLSFLAGLYPNMGNLIVSHSEGLAKAFYSRVLELMEDTQYRWKKIFDTVGGIETDAKELTIDINKKHPFATLQFKGIQSKMTGSTRAQKFLILDDLVSDLEEAMNEERLATLNETYESKVLQRTIDGTKILHIGTRWSVRDVIGKVQEKHNGNPRARFVVKPALDENDESNFNYRFGVGFSTEFFKAMRKELSELNWLALYQNEPVERLGLMFAKDGLKYFYELPEGEPDAILGVCDTKNRGDDYCVLPIGYKYGDYTYVVDVLCNNAQPEIIEPQIVAKIEKNNPQLVEFESNNAGYRIAEDIERALRAVGNRTTIATKYTAANKQTKIEVYSGKIREFLVFKHESLWDVDYKKYMQLLTSYTVIGKVKHDDAADATAMLAELTERIGGRKAVIFKRPF